MRKVVLVLAGVAFCLSTFAQSSKKQRKEEKRLRIEKMAKLEEEGVIVYNKQFAAGAKLISDGYGAFVEFGRAKSVKKSLLFQFEMAERKSPREQKLTSVTGVGAPLIPEKVNFFYPLKLGVQVQRLLGNKSNKNGVNITANAGGGLALGLIRPYMVEIPKGNDLTYVKYNSPDSLDFVSSPVGGPTFSTGWDQLTVNPGVYLKGALRFDYGPFNETLSGIEVGISLEAYTKKTQLMVHQGGQNVYFTGYFALLIGRRR
jgi:hypothetical protein